MNTKTEIYLPSVAIFPDDLRSRIEILKPAREKGFKIGLMLIIRGPGDLEVEVVEKQLANLIKLTASDDFLVFVMHPNMPLSGLKRFNFLDNPDWSVEYVRKSIDFATAIPQKLIPPSGQMVTFHLNTLVSPKDWIDDSRYWDEKFEQILLRIKRLVEYASTKKVALSLETTPIPEFGDIPRDDQHRLEDGTYWSDLGNPWPLFPWSNEINKLREIGISIKIDFCHSFIGMSSLKEIAHLVSIGKKSEALKTYKTFADDLAHADSVDEFSQQVLDITQDGDVWDVNDAIGIYKTPQLHSEQDYYKEGITLFDGDIPKKHLERLIRTGLKKNIKFVIEVHETDFASSPNTKKSLDRVLQFI